MSSSAGKPVEFRAGKMNYDSATKKVTPDTRQGRVRVYLNNDGEKHFEWRDEAGNLENDIYVFEFDAKFSRLKSGRVFLLHFESYDEKYFFWMQEPDASKDDEICKKVNDLINFTGEPEGMETEPPIPAQTSNQTSQQARPQGQAGGADFSKLLGDALKSIQQGGGMMRKPTPNLIDILTPQFFETVLQDKEYLDALQQHLPDKQQNAEGLKSSLKSAQLQQAIDALDEAINSEEGMTVLMSLGFDASVFTQARDGTEALILALEKWAREHGNK